MKLRAIEIANVRRFAGRRVALSGIGDGITVLSEPNEFGKSTIFDALYALFFERHRSTRAAVKALQPHAGGAPEVTVEVDLPEGRFRIAKRWLSRPQARVSDAAGRIVAQDDEAEAWIDRLLSAGVAGPSGLLWVRQGLTGLEPDGSGADEKRARDQGLATRRDLLSSVAGEIDMMTGGRRMDAVLDRVAEALARLATATGRPRAGGDWARALDEAAALAAEEADLRPRAERLSDDLRRRADLMRRQAQLSDPEALRQRTLALEQARAAHQAAKDHAEQVATARREADLARLNHTATRTEIARLDQLAARLQAAHSACDEAQRRAEGARNRAEDLALRDRQAAEAAGLASAEARSLRGRLGAAQRAGLAAAARRRAEDLARHLARALDLDQHLREGRAQQALLSVTPTALKAAEAAQGALDRVIARSEAQAVTLSIRYDGPARALVNGAALEPGSHPVLAVCDIVLPGLGQLQIDPRPSVQGQDPAQLRTAAEAALAQALTACGGAASLADARRALAAAERLDDSLRQIAAALTDTAPDGIEAMRQALEAARAQAASAPESAIEAADDPAALEPILAQAEAAEAATAAAAQTAHALSVAAGEARALAEGERLSAERALQDCLTEAGDPARRAADLGRLHDSLAARSADLDRAADRLARLLAAAPDLATAEAGLARASSAVDQARRDGEALREELATLNTRIEVLAEEGIEETLAAITGQRAEAEARGARYEAEVKALNRLREALTHARAQARDAYFGPVLRELEPLLAILHPGAALQIDDSSLLPAALTRNGQAEAIEILSGGTREQLAILTRLAFARLFSRAGQSIPVILDDALVHSDDDRIEAMFTALHRVAKDQQILVLTCRQRAFAALGGQRADLRITDIGALP